ncbi:MAG: TatD family hydrolase, partial [Alistipes sp.]|nr:TatD family hydrolase [Alistipes sp.]
MIDTHSHIYAEEFDTDREEALERAWSAGVEALILPDIDSESRNRMVALAQQHADRCYAMAGL